MTDPCSKFFLGLLSGFQLSFKRTKNREINKFLKYLPGFIYSSLILVIVTKYDKVESVSFYCMDIVLNLMRAFLWYYSFDSIQQLLEGIHSYDTRFGCHITEFKCQDNTSFECLDADFKCHESPCKCSKNGIDAYLYYACSLFLTVNAIYWHSSNWPNGFNTTRAIITFISRVYQLLIPILFKALLDGLTQRFNQLGARLRLMTSFGGDESCRQNSSIIFSSYEAHTALLDLVELLNDSFGLQMLYSTIVQFGIVLMFTIDPQHLLVLLNFSYIAWFNYALNASADKLSLASETSLDELSTTPLFGLSESALLQVEVWMLQFESSTGAEVSFAFFFTPSKSSYVSMVLAATTYSILILQITATNNDIPASLNMIRGFFSHL